MPHWRYLRWLVVPLGAVGIVTGIDLAQSPQRGSRLSAADWTAAGYGPGDYDTTVRRLAEQFDLAGERSANGPGQWLRQESLARAHMARSRFATGYEDLAQARRILDHALSEAPVNSGPLLSIAVLGMMSHRLAAPAKRSTPSTLGRSHPRRATGPRFSVCAATSRFTAATWAVRGAGMRAPQRSMAPQR